MAVGKPDFDLNSFGVKYLSKDQVQDFLEINKFGKNIGDTPDPVEETTDKDGKVIQKKPHPQKGEVFTDIKGGNPHQNPKPIKRGGFKNRQMRRIVNGKKVKVGQTEEETTPPEGQVPTSRLNDVQFGKLGEESTDQVRESFDYHTNSPKWQEAINRDAELTTEEGTAKFDDTPANRALRDKIAMREHKKKLAAEKKKKKNKKKANDIIMDMNIMKLELMKDSKDGKQSKDGLPIRNGELKDLISGDDTREHVAEATRLGNEKRDIDEEFKKRYGFKNTPKNWKHFGRKNRMSGGTKESLKSDLMKDALDPKAKPQEDLLGNPNTALPKNTRVGQKPPKVIDMGDSEMDYGTGEQFGNPFHGSTTRTTAQGIKNQNKPRYQSTDPGAKYYKNPKVGGSKTDPKSADGKNTYKSAEETIFKAISLKLDLMKDGIEGGGKNIPKYPRSFRSERAWDHGSQHKEGQAERERSEYDRESIVGYGGETSDNPTGRPYAKGKRPVKGVNSKPDSRIDPEDYTDDEKDEMGSTGDASSYPADPAQKRYPADASGTTSKYMQHWDETMGEHRQRGTEHNTHQEPSKLDSKDRGTTLPKGLKKKAEETIFKATSLKLDLMKDALNPNEKPDYDYKHTKPDQTREGQSKRLPDKKYDDGVDSTGQKPKPPPPEKPKYQSIKIPKKIIDDMIKPEKARFSEGLYIDKDPKDL